MIDMRLGFCVLRREGEGRQEKNAQGNRENITAYCEYIRRREENQVGEALRLILRCATQKGDMVPSPVFVKGRAAFLPDTTFR